MSDEERAEVISWLRDCGYIIPKGESTDGELLQMLWQEVRPPDYEEAPNMNGTHPDDNANTEFY